MEPTGSLVGLVAFSADEVREFMVAETADYAAWLVERGDAPDMPSAKARAQTHIEPEIQAAARAGDWFWVGRTPSGVTIGWVWVGPMVAGAPSDAAFLEQILVTPNQRRKGVGRALYARAGYELVRQLEGKQQLRKPLETIEA